MDDLVRGTLAMLTSKAFGLTRNLADAEDAVQHTYLQAHRSWGLVGALRPPQQRAWLLKTLTNAVYENARRPHRRYEYLGDDQVAGDRQLSAGPDSQALERWRMTQAAMKTMTRVSAQCLMLFALGYPYKEISEILGISAVAARVHVFRARSILHQAEAADGNDLVIAQPQGGGA